MGIPRFLNYNYNQILALIYFLIVLIILIPYRNKDINNQEENAYQISLLLSIHLLHRLLEPLEIIVGNDQGGQIRYVPWLPLEGSSK